MAVNFFGPVGVVVAGDLVVCMGECGRRKKKRRMALCSLLLAVSMEASGAQWLCANPASGAVAIRPKCKSAERRLNLGDLEKPGPQGTQGAPGIQGPPGVAATAGPCDGSEIQGNWKAYYSLRFVHPSDRNNQIDGIGSTTLAVDQDGKIASSIFNVQDDAKNASFSFYAGTASLDTSCKVSVSATLRARTTSGMEIIIEGQMDSLGKNTVYGLFHRMPPPYVPNSTYIYYPLGLITLVKQP